MDIARCVSARLQILLLAAGMAVPCVAVADAQTAGPEWRQDATRVRARNATLALLVRHAVERSATFRELVRTIDASDGLVYIGPGGCPGAAVRACLIHQLTKAGPNRVLHILVDTNRGERDVMSAIAHELAHAIEVLSDPRISNDEALIAFYRAHGVRMKGVLETYAAIQAGVSVGTELSRK